MAMMVRMSAIVFQFLFSLLAPALFAGAKPPPRKLNEDRCFSDWLDCDEIDYEGGDEALKDAPVISQWW